MRVRVPSATAQPTSSFRTAPSALNREAADLPVEPMASADSHASQGPTEIVTRPTGLRHGRWEAPTWTFWTVGAAVLVLALIYALVRVGVLKRKSK